MTVGNVATEKKESLSTQFLGGIVKGLENALGQLATKEFWIKLASMLIKQMVNAFLIALGGKLLAYGMSREDPEVKRNATQFSGQSSASSAFASPQRESEYMRAAYNRQPQDFRPYSSQQTPVEKAFPGFGGTV